MATQRKDDRFEDAIPGTPVSLRVAMSGGTITPTLRAVLRRHATVLNRFYPGIGDCRTVVRCGADPNGAPSYFVRILTQFDRNLVSARQNSASVDAALDEAFTAFIAALERRARGHHASAGDGNR